MKTAYELYDNLHGILDEARGSIRELMEKNNCREVNISSYRKFADEYSIFIPKLSYYPIETNEPRVQVFLEGVHLTPEHIYFDTRRVDDGGYEVIDETDIDCIEAVGLLLCLETVFRLIDEGKLEYYACENTRKDMVEGIRLAVHNNGDYPIELEGIWIEMDGVYEEVLNICDYRPEGLGVMMEDCSVIPLDRLSDSDVEDIWYSLCK